MFPEGSWERGVVEFKHIKSIPVKFKREVKLAGDLQASLLLWGQVSELVYMQGCWPSNSSQHCGSWWIQMIQMREEPSSQNMFGRAAARQLGGVVSQLAEESETPLQPFVWHCHELGTAQSNVAGGDVAMATAALGQVATLIEPGGQLFNRPEREKKWLTGPANKACSGMWGYVAAIVQQTSQERTQNHFHPFNLLFDPALRWTSPQPFLMLTWCLFISNLLHQA